MLNISVKKLDYIDALGVKNNSNSFQDNKEKNIEK